MDTRQPTVSVIVPAFDSEETIKSCLDSIMKQEYPKSKMEILVVDNGSSDNTLDVIAEYRPRVKIIVEPKRGRGATYDRGLREAKCDYVAYLDSDAVAPVDWLKNAMQIMVSNSSVVAVYFKTLAPSDSSYFQKCIDTLLCKSWGGANGVVYRRKVLEEIGGFNVLLSYLQEDDVAIKLLERGYKAQVEPERVIWHYPRQSFKSYFVQCVESGIGSIRLFSITRRSRLFMSILARTMVAVFPLVSMALFTFFSPSLVWIPAFGTVMCALVYAAHLCFSTNQKYRSMKYVLPATFLMWVSTLANLCGYIIGLHEILIRD